MVFIRRLLNSNSSLFWFFLAEYLHYPISDENDLIEFLHQIDGKQLYEMTYQKDYVPGFGRKGFGRIWSVCIESNMA